MTKTARPSEIDALIEDLTVDAHDDEEQLSGFLVGAEEALQRREPAQLVGVEVKVVKVDAGPDVRTRPDRLRPTRRHHVRRFPR